ncbi:MAG: DUF2520 domain-containing protein [Bacteroidetes bacterium]|nr:DUF2520 domain-containing protein [Bacteroidota bacterium]
MTAKFGISIIGAGRVGWHLAQALSAAGYTIHEVWSLRHSQAELLTEKLPNAVATHSLDLTASKARLFLLTVTDAALEDTSRRLILPPGAVLAHTSGSQPLEVLQSAARQSGVFYPLQTFSKEKAVDFANIPVCIEASDEETTGLLEQVAYELSNHVIRLSAAQRRQLHLAAVFACNFSNYMLRIAHELLEESSMPADLLHPLIEETLQKALTLGPQQAQTGPALRGDTPILELHQKQLFRHPQWATLYKLISDDIRQNTSNKENKRTP